MFGSGPPQIGRRDARIEREIGVLEQFVAPEQSGGGKADDAFTVARHQNVA